MISEQELRAAIASTLSEHDPNAWTCVKLAAYYTCLNATGQKENVEQAKQQSYTPVEIIEPEYSSTTAFGRAIRGKDREKVIAFLDNLISTSIRYALPQMYADILRIVRAM